MTRYASLTDAEILDDYLHWRARHTGWSADTVKVRGSQLRRLVVHLADHGTTLATATRQDYTLWLAEWERAYRMMAGRAPSHDAMAGLISAAKGLSEYVIDELELREDDPTRRLKRPRLRKRLPRPMPEDDVRRTLIMASGDPLLFAAFALVFCLGLRSGELCRLAKTDIELCGDGSAIVWVAEGKSREPRRVPVPAGVMDVIAPMLSRFGEALLATSTGRFYAPTALNKKLNRFLREEVRTRFTLHTGRHRFGTDYNSFDPNVFRQARLMGHASSATTERYTQIRIDDTIGPMTELAQQRLAPVADLTTRRAQRRGRPAS